MYASIKFMNISWIKTFKISIYLLDDKAVYDFILTIAGPNIHSTCDQIFSIRLGRSQPLSYFQTCDLSDKVAELHETLATLKRESEQKIEKLRAENEEASKAIERLQIQLKQQTELNSLKNNLMWVFYFFSSSNFLFSKRIRNPAQCPTFFGKKNNLVREMD